MVEVVNLPPASAPPRWQLVGFTSTSHTGDAGVLAFTVACQAELGAVSRMCTSQEVLDTVTVPGSLTGSAWVRPAFVPVSVAVYGLQRAIQTALDASGLTGSGPGDLNCNGWATAGSSTSGLAVSATGSFTKSACNQTIAVACCALVP